MKLDSGIKLLTVITICLLYTVSGFSECNLPSGKLGFYEISTKDGYHYKDAMLGRNVGVLEPGSKVNIVDCWKTYAVTDDGKWLNIGGYRRKAFKRISDKEALEPVIDKIGDMVNGESDEDCEDPPTSTEQYPSKLTCTLGAKLQTVGKGKICVAGVNAVGPFTAKMKELCVKYGGGVSCSSKIWNARMAKSTRGGGVCPRGSKLDKNSNLCTDGIYFYGPFTASQLAHCKNAGGGKNCDSMRLTASLIGQTKAPDVEEDEPIPSTPPAGTRPQRPTEPPRQPERPIAPSRPDRPTTPTRPDRPTPPTADRGEEIENNENIIESLPTRPSRPPRPTPPIEPTRPEPPQRPQRPVTPPDNGANNSLPTKPHPVIRSAGKGVSISEGSITFDKLGFIGTTQTGQVMNCDMRLGFEGMPRKEFKTIKINMQPNQIAGVKVYRYMKVLTGFTLGGTTGRKIADIRIYGKCEDDKEFFRVPFDVR